jgi:hypothetical protein
MEKPPRAALRALYTLVRRSQRACIAKKDTIPIKNQVMTAETPLQDLYQKTNIVIFCNAPPWNRRYDKLSSIVLAGDCAAMLLAITGDL